MKIKNKIVHYTVNKEKTTKHETGKVQAEVNLLKIRSTRWIRNK